MWGFFSQLQLAHASQDHQQMIQSHSKIMEISLERLPKTGLRWPGSMQLIYRSMICIICLNNSIYIYIRFL